MCQKGCYPFQMDVSHPSEAQETKPLSMYCRNVIFLCSIQNRGKMLR